MDMLVVVVFVVDTIAVVLERRMFLQMAEVAFAELDAIVAAADTVALLHSLVAASWDMLPVAVAVRANVAMLVAVE